MEPYESEATSVEVGPRLRELRDERGLSMRALARMSGISANALSMIERGRTSPSVSTLYKITGALEVPITTLFRVQPEGSDIVYRKSTERTRVPFSRGLWEGLGGEEFSGRVEPFMLTLESGANSGPFSMAHSGHEFVLCLRGRLEYHVANQIFTLEPGDTLLFASQLKHRWRNTGSTVANVVFVLAGFEPDDLPGGVHYSTEEKDVQGEASSEDGTENTK